MNSNFEQKNTKPTMAEMQAMQEEPAQPEPTIEPETPDMDGPVLR